MGPLLDELEPVPEGDELGCAGLESRFAVPEPEVLPKLLGLLLELSLPDLLVLLEEPELLEPDIPVSVLPDRLDELEPDVSEEPDMPEELALTPNCWAVSESTLPVAFRLFDFWNERRAFCVFWPITPSIGPGSKPLSFNASCICLTLPCPAALLPVLLRLIDDERPDCMSLLLDEPLDWPMEELPVFWSVMLLPDEPVPVGPLLDELEPVAEDDELGCAGLESRFEVAEPDVLPNLLGFVPELSLPDLL